MTKSKEVMVPVGISLTVLTLILWLLNRLCKPPNGNGIPCTIHVPKALSDSEGDRGKSVHSGEGEYKLEKDQEVEEIRPLTGDWTGRLGEITS